MSIWTLGFIYIENGGYMVVGGSTGSWPVKNEYEIKDSRECE